MDAFAILIAITINPSGCVLECPLFYGILHFFTRLFDLLPSFFYSLINFLASFLDRTFFCATR